jgi:hypothetical protein
MNMRLLFLGYFVLVNNLVCKAVDEPKKLVGEIGIFSSNLFKLENYPPFTGLDRKLKNIIDADGKPLQLKPTDIIVHVGVGDIGFDEKGNSIDWAHHEHPDLGKFNFPDHLPFTMLDGKKAGDIISFKFKNPDTKRMFLIELQQYEPDTFAATLQKLKKQFDDPVEVEKAEAYYGPNRKKWAFFEEEHIKNKVDHSFNGFMRYYRDAMQ